MTHTFACGGRLPGGARQQKGRKRMSLDEISGGTGTPAKKQSDDEMQPIRKDAYRKECRSTLLFGACYVLLAHTGLFAVILGYDNDLRVLGFPLHYFVAIVAGSLGVLIVSIVWNLHADRLEDAIQEENRKTEVTQ